MMKQRRLQGRLAGPAAAALLAAGLITGCGSQDEPGGGLPSFGSLEEAYAAVDAVLGCEADPVGEPIVPTDGGKLTSEQRLCTENVQVDLYPDADALQRSYELMSSSQQGAVYLVRGGNWMVVDVTEIATGEPTTWDLEGLAEELQGEYTVVGA